MFQLTATDGTKTKLTALTGLDKDGKDNLTWSAVGKAKAGTYSGKAIFTFKKKNAKPGDTSFEVPSNEKTGVVVEAPPPPDM